MPFIVYLRRRDEPAAMPDARSYPTMDEAAKACIALTNEGYDIHSVKLPTGSYVTGKQIEWAIRVGVHSVKIALTH